MDEFETQTTDLETEDDIALADRMRAGREQILSEIHKRIIGQRQVIDETLLTLFVGGNSLIIGVPGLAKTLLIQTMAQVLDLKFARIQFTPDLMPSDITGTDIIQEDAETGGRKMVFAPGPVFTNILLADEINRTPPKTQSALLESMQEHRVTVQGRTYTLEEPFFVFATQNPIELEGTYPLPEAQLDRFMFFIVIDHPPEEEELEVVRTTTGLVEPEYNHAVTGADLIAFQRLVRRVPVSEPVMRYALSLARTRTATHLSRCSPQRICRARLWNSTTSSPLTTVASCGGASPVVESRISTRSSSGGMSIRSLNRKRSSWASGSG